MATFDAGYFVEAPVLVDAATAAVPAHLYGASCFVWVDSMSQILLLTIADDQTSGQLCAVGTMDGVKGFGSRDYVGC